MRQQSRKGDGSLLVVDDEKDLRMALCQWLQQLGWTTRQSAHGQEALDLLLGGYCPSVILLDQDMPVMGGPLLLKALRTESALAGIPVIRMSGREWSDLSTPLLLKPFDLRQLTKLLATLAPESLARER